MKNPVIAIDRQAKSWAIFDDITLISGFFPYKDEAKALEVAKRAIKEETDVEPRVVYPKITKMVCR